MLNSTVIEWIGFLQSFPDSQSQNSQNLAAYNWLYAAFCSALVGLTGLVPIFLLPNQDFLQNNPQEHQLNNEHSEEESNNNLKKKQEKSKNSQNKSEKIQAENPDLPKGLRWMLSFAVGGLLGDTFLHLLPEALSSAQNHQDYNKIGLFVLFGLLVFTIVEKVLENSISNSENSQKSASGYLNLIANCIDNFNHGLAVGGAFLVSTKVGFVTTGCILIHEIPHEIGDFAILMKSGFSRSEAAKAQFSTAFVGIFGAIMALVLDWTGCGILAFFIVPFTCGGFLHIAMVSVLPDLLASEDLGDFFKVMSGILCGIGTMLAVTLA